MYEAVHSIAAVSGIIGSADVCSLVPRCKSLIVNVSSLDYVVSSVKNPYWGCFHFYNVPFC